MLDYLSGVLSTPPM